MATPPPPRMPAKPKKPVAAWRLKLGKAIGWVLALTVASQLLQVFLAGAGLLGPSSDYLDMHALFANAGVRLAYLLVILIGFIGADWRMGVVGVVLMALLEVQFPLIGATDAAVRGLHAANGVIMLTIAVAALMRRLPWAPLGPPRSSPAPAAAPAVPARPTALRPAPTPAARPASPPRPPLAPKP